MGRHSGSPEPSPVPSVAQPAARLPVSSPGPPDARSWVPARLLDRAVLAVFAAAGTGAVMAWADAPPTAWLLGAAGTGVVVVIAAQLAGPPPGPADNPRTTDPPDDEP